MNQGVLRRCACSHARRAHYYCRQGDEGREYVAEKRRERGLVHENHEQRSIEAQLARQ
jgi:hypothetical protein